jgi:hypothetical protein
MLILRIFKSFFLLRLKSIIILLILIKIILTLLLFHSSTLLLMHLQLLLVKLLFILQSFFETLLIPLLLTILWRKSFLTTFITITLLNLSILRTFRAIRIRSIFGPRICTSLWAKSRTHCIISSTSTPLIFLIYCLI